MTVGIVLTLAGLVLYRKDKRIWAIVFSTVLLQGMYFSVYLTPYNYRLLTFTPVVLIMVSVIYVSRVNSNLFQRLIFGLGVVSMIFSFITTLDVDYFKDPLMAWKDYLHSYKEDRTIVRFDYSSDKFKQDKSFLFLDQFVSQNEPVLYVTQHEPGYDDVIIAAYYDNNLRRRVVWGGHINNSPFFYPDGQAKPALIPYMREHEISYLHNNIVFYFTEPVELQLGSEFVEVTKNVYYLTPGES